MALAINILITLIGLTAVVALCYNYMNKMFLELAEKYKLSHLFDSSKHNYGALSEIFHEYKHKNIEDWFKATTAQSEEIQTEAITKLIEHIDGSPASWGAITPEAIKVLADFQDTGHLIVLKSVLSTCKKVWDKYTISEQCYEAACRAIIKLGASSSKEILSAELKNKNKGNDDTTICIINSFSEFSEEDNIADLFTQIFADSQSSYKSRSHAINMAESNRPAEEYHKALVDAITTFANDQNRVMSGDDNKIFEQIFNLITKEIDDVTFDLILNCCNSEHIAKVTIKSLEFILKTNANVFSPKQLYMLINISADELQQLVSALATNFNLSPAEKELCLYKDISKDSEFHKSSMAEEVLKKPLIIPNEAKETYEKLKEAFRMKANKKHGGLALTGLAENEKLYLSRAFAADKHWTFIYGVYEDIANSGSATKQFMESIHKHKPCIIYLDDVSTLVKNTQDPFVKNLKQLLADQMMFVIGTIKEDADIDDEGCSVIFKKSEELKSLFPLAVQITMLQDFQKNLILQAKIGQIQPGRGADTWEQYNIFKPTNNMTAFDFEKYLAKYFRAALLVHGKMIDIAEFEELDAVNFPGRGNL